MPESTQLYQIPPEFSGLRLDQALAKLLPDFSRSRLQIWIREGRVRVDGESATPRLRLIGGESVEVEEIPVTVEPPPAAEAMDLDIVFEDPHLIVINKPAGLVVHPGAGIASGTLLNGLLHHDPALNEIPRAGIIHRLDKETSGLMVIARTLQSHKFLTDLLAEREVTREYLTLVHGWIIAGGTVDEPIGRHRSERTRMAVTMGGREARTHYRIDRHWPHHTLLRVQLETGRTHQIRVHMRHIKHPVVGDPTYGTRTQPPARCGTELRNGLLGFKRQALHATRLGLIHPKSGEAMEWQRPIPDDFQNLVNLLDQEYEQP